MGVLHHAANSTAKLLHEAARVARKWIVVVEDLDTGANAKRNTKHDPNGIFRRREEWESLFRVHCPDFEVTGQAFAAQRKYNGEIVVGVGGRNPWVYGFALQRKEAN